MRLDYFDVAKGIGIILVILGHMKLSYLSSQMIFSFHMPLFFLISGYFFKQEDFDDVILKKGKHLLLPYIYTCLAIIVFSSIFAAAYYHTGVLSNIKQWLWASFYGAGSPIRKPFFVKSIGAVWFLYALFWGSVLLNQILNIKKYQYIIVGIIVFIGYKSTRIFNLPFSVQVGMVALGYIYTGYILKSKIGDLSKYFGNIHLVFCSFILWCIGIYCGCGRLYMVTNYYGMHFWDVFNSLLGCFTFIGLSYFLYSHFPKICSKLIWLGQHSLLILCVHLVELNCIPWHRFIHFPYTTVLIFLAKLIFIIGVTYAWNKYIGKVQMLNVGGRSSLSVHWRIQWIDIAKGITILLMILGHTKIPSLLRVWIFSFHIPSFFIASGYFIKKRIFADDFKAVLHNLFRPYTLASFLALFVALWKYLFYSSKANIHMIHVADICHRYLESWIYGISFSSVVLKDVMSVGPIWFIVCLLAARVIFGIIIRFTDKLALQGLVSIVLSFIGYYVGKKVAFLPYSFDVALVTMPYLFLGYYMGVSNKKWKPNLCDMKLIIPSCFVWTLSLYYNGIELAIRSYPKFPLCIIGSMAGSIVMFAIAKYLERFTLLGSTLEFYGRHSLIVLIVHMLELKFVGWYQFLPDIHWLHLFTLKIILITSCVVLYIFIKMYGRDILFILMDKYRKRSVKAMCTAASCCRNAAGH